MIEEEIKTLSSWRLELKRFGKPYWLKMYQHFLGSTVSNIPRFYRALNLYGDWPLFESILASSTSNIEGDPLSYVLKVAHSKWKEMQEDEDAETDYLAEIEQAKKISQQKNDELAKKLKKKGGKNV